MVRYSVAVIFLVIGGLGNVLAAVPGETEQLFEHYKDYVLQVRILDRASSSKASIGSGFLVGSAGLIVTNFHVIAELVHKPSQYRAEYVFDNGKTGDLKLLDIDVVHDLALLKGELPSDGHFDIDAREPAKGERLFSLGNPHDLGLTIVEGTYNGHLEKSLYKKIHFTGSINPGMSGGPTINRDGRVIGVNVATAGNQLSFLVPAAYVTQLLTHVRESGEITEFLQLARDQLMANQNQYMEALLAKPFATVAMSDFSLPGQLAPFVNCWGDTRKRENALYEQIYYTCATNDNIFLSSEQSSGIIRYSHELYTSKGLGVIRFFTFLEQVFQPQRLQLSGDEDMVTNYECDSGFVEFNGLPSKTVFCLRAYKKFPDLYDAVLMTAVLTDNSRLLVSSLLLAGVSYENAIRFPQTYLKAMTWNR